LVILIGKIIRMLTGRHNTAIFESLEKVDVVVCGKTGVQNNREPWRNRIGAIRCGSWSLAGWFSLIF
jgi:hypothetical protein